VMAHISELAIDRLVAGELTMLDADAARSHAAGCARCGGLLDDALATKARFAADIPQLALPVPLRARRSTRLWAIVAGGMLAAAAAIVLLVRARGPADGDVDGTRAKGRAHLGFYVSHAGDVRRGAGGERVVPGDAIELYSNAVDYGWFAVTSVDGAGARTVYIAPRPYAPGREEIVPQSIVLDATLGTETITGIFCAGPFDPAAPPDDCTFDRFTIEKAQR
jgi:hypothetical protein